MFYRVVRGDVVTWQEVLLSGYVGVADGKIAYLGADDPSAAKVREDHNGAFLFPGAIDAQVHSRSQKGHKKLTRATMATVAGGVTANSEMPYDKRQLVCNAEAIAEKADDVAAQAHVDGGIYGTTNPAEGVVHISSDLSRHDVSAADHRHRAYRATDRASRVPHREGSRRVLETVDGNIGVVTGIAGIIWIHVTVSGITDHAEPRS